MMLKAYSIRDAKAEIYNDPFYRKTHGEAERDFSQLVNDPKSKIHEFPEDYDLYFVGEWNDNTGSFIPLDTPQHVQKAMHVKKTLKMADPSHCQITGSEMRSVQ